MRGFKSALTGLVFHPAGAKLTALLAGRLIARERHGEWGTPPAAEQPHV